MRHQLLIEIRFHGRGGQGAVIASNILASAAFKEGKYVQAFPLFGGERRGAPVMAFTRLDSEPILVRCQVYTPDHVVILDHSLLGVANVTAGLRDGGWVVVNSERSPAELGFPKGYRVASVDASGIATSFGLGTRSSPIVNTAIVGALARVTQLVGLEAVVAAVREEVPNKPEANAAAVVEAYRQVRVAPDSIASVSRDRGLG